METGIESQIVANIHRFVAETLHLNLDEASILADELHHQFGSTIEGLRQTVWKNNNEKTNQLLCSFYDSVYRGIDCRGTLLRRGDYQSHSTGYSHTAETDAIRKILQHHQDDVEWHIASNSPTHHIQKVIQSLGLTRVPWKGIWTPDTSRPESNVLYPTKLHPRDFWSEDVLQSSMDKSFLLIDDSKTTIDKCREHGLRAIHVDHRNMTLQNALLRALGYIEQDYEFSDVEYLQAKNIVDENSINHATWLRMVQELSSLLNKTSSAVLRVVDVGAGLLSMWKLLWNGSERLPSIHEYVSVQDIQYFAYEPNISLRSKIFQNLLGFGFHQITPFTEDTDEEIVFVREATSGHPRCTVHLRFWDYRESKSITIQPVPHLIVGCCFADLMSPTDLATSLVRTFLYERGMDGCNHSLVYFPITFCGVTQFLPPKPFEETGNMPSAIPSDTTAFRLYSKALSATFGHNLEPWRTELALLDFGAECVAHGMSDWIIHPTKNEHLWKTMLYFFGSVAATEMRALGWNALAWLDRARTDQRTIQVSNMDLLFRVPILGQFPLQKAIYHHKTSAKTHMHHRRKEILFAAPRQVNTVEKDSIRQLEGSQIRIRTECSLISSGTELKVFRGQFEDAALDVNIEEMKEARMAYPLAYGYSLVGKVVECGEDVEDTEKILGKRVFTFSPHASEVVTERSAVQLVPIGLDPFDAIFMPSVETALSLIHDTRPFIGEKIAIFGQGLIGLLVTAILSKMKMDESSHFGTITTFDTLPDRLAASVAMGASQALFPAEASRAGPFDATIEISGNSKALQAAIDYTRDGGRIVIGSWYGNENTILKLGIDFHRSHKSLKASQVSEIPTELSKTWTKERRFALAWETVKSVKPSRLITRKANLDEAQAAYAALDNGTELAVAFQYD
jgi:threonine dehydrogenase-like Zn-dependent dehydrogenase